ncbi:MAG: hypothetical protein AB7V34_03170 [Brachymonas sp.]
MTAALPIRPSAAPARALRGPAALLLTGLTLLTSACVAPLPYATTDSGVWSDVGVVQPDPLLIPYDPPPVLVETPPPMPFIGAIWIGGYWTWQNQWVWARGHWASAPRPGYTWTHPYYAHRGNGVVFVNGHWTAPGHRFVPPGPSTPVHAVQPPVNGRPWGATAPHAPTAPAGNPTGWMHATQGRTAPAISPAAQPGTPAPAAVPRPAWMSQRPRNLPNSPAAEQRRMAPQAQRVERARTFQRDPRASQQPQQQRPNNRPQEHRESHDSRSEPHF